MNSSIIKNLLFFFLAISIISCSDEGDDGMGSDNFEDQFSFTIDGKSYDFDEFEVKLDWLESQDRIFIRKEDGEEFFTFNLPLDLGDGTHGMDWNNGGPFFFMDLEQGGFYTLDESTCKITVGSVDTLERRVKVTFEGIGTQAISSDQVEFSNGILNVNY